MVLPIDPTLLAKGPEWQIQSPAATPGPGQGGQNFGAVTGFGRTPVLRRGTHVPKL